MGIDHSSEMLSHAQKKANKYLVQGVAEALPFPDRSFDAVTLITVLEFVPDPEKVIREVFRVCKDRLVLGVLNRYSSLYLWKRIKGTFARTSYKEACFQTVRSLKHLIEPIAPGCSIEYKTTLVLRPIPGLGALFEQQLTRMGFPFGAFLVMRVSRES
jgi:ubiquinone/menaquinone biosynthesis C-methylase UbiE